MVANGCHFCFIHSFASILAEIETVFKITFLWKIVQQLISESVLKSRTFSQTWDCNALECNLKDLTVNHLIPQEFGHALQTSTSNCKTDDKALVSWLLDVCSLAQMLKNLNLKVYNIQISQPTERIRTKLCIYTAFSLSEKYFHQKKGLVWCTKMAVVSIHCFRTQIG